MTNDKKMSGDARQTYIVEQLQQATEPITGSTFAEETNVSRQVIVQDVSVLKAKGEPIIATSQGYLYLQQEGNTEAFRRTVVCRHTPEEAKTELYAIVDHGVRVYDVKVEHPVYGDLTGIVNVSNRHEVNLFVEKVQATSASLLSELTEGIHLHTIEADTEEQLDAACQALREKGILFEAKED